MIRSKWGLVTRRWVALLVALGVDSFGSGSFQPLVLVYATRAVGLPLAVAGTVVTVGTGVGLLVPPVAGRLVDRVGPRTVVIAAQVMQALGALSYLAANGTAMTLVAAILLAAGLQLFFCALFSLIADVSAAGPKDRPFAIVSMVRAACFGLGALVAGGLLSAIGIASMRAMAGVDALSFLLCAVALALLVRAPGSLRRSGEAAEGRRRGVLQNRPYLALIGVTALLVLPMDFFAVGGPVYVIQQLHGPAWLPGSGLALLTFLESVGATATVRATRRFARTTTLVLSAGLYALWCVVSLGAVVVAPAWLAAWVLGGTLIQSAASLLFGTRANALAEAAAPREMRGRYLAAFQYAFTLAQVTAPAVVSLFSAGIWVPWTVVAASSCAAMFGLRWLTPRLPAHAVTPAQNPAAVTPQGGTGG